MTNVEMLPRLRRLFDRSLRVFREDDLENILNGVSERRLCHRLSMPMERLAHDAGFQQYRADVDYNRANDGRLKTIAGETSRRLQSPATSYFTVAAGLPILTT
ncbi:hypothetical protein IGS74_03115 [Aureimonas sp. OT7]|uniref:hypothetical protein n=1 Tax=Aureimonas sp. OT7 TaxID=2816454 RepID=UPI0017849954|nr:hypothetical protein [Aureimonas sp. OT7]QOG07270.1 hypothetical protein IGS74_03115 [Aureimonas sp. OT7]